MEKKRKKSQHGSKAMQGRLVKMLHFPHLLRGTQTCNIFSRLKQIYIRHRKINLIKILYQAIITLPIIALEQDKSSKRNFRRNRFYECVVALHKYNAC